MEPTSGSSGAPASGSLFPQSGRIPVGTDGAAVEPGRTTPERESGSFETSRTSEGSRAARAVSVASVFNAARAFRWGTAFGTARAFSAITAATGTAILVCSVLLATGKIAPTHIVHAAGDTSSETAKLQLYKASAEPVLRTNCYRCHAGLNHRGGLQMDTRAALLKGGHDGPAVVPGHPEQSLLIKLIRHEGPKDDPMPMPPNGNKLSDADIAVITQWVSDGAVMDR